MTQCCKSRVKVTGEVLTEEQVTSSGGGGGGGGER